MKLYIVRHGETMFNVKRIVQGWCDSPLTARGREQAEACGRGLKDIPFDYAYCSTSERTLDTALGILKGRDLAVQPLKALKEMNFGEAEGDAMDEWFDEPEAIIGKFADIIHGAVDSSRILCRNLMAHLNSAVFIHPLFLQQAD